MMYIHLTNLIPVGSALFNQKVHSILDKLTDEYEAGHLTIDEEGEGGAPTNTAGGAMPDHAPTDGSAKKKKKKKDNSIATLKRLNKSGGEKE